MKKEFKKAKSTGTRNNLYAVTKNATAGITLIALVITIVVLLILARSKHINLNR